MFSRVSEFQHAVYTGNTFESVEMALPKVMKNGALL